MSWNIKIEGNYFYATNTVSHIVNDYPAKKVRIAKKYDDSDYFVFQYDGIDIPGMSKVPFANIVAENGTDFTDLASFELWKNENTGSSGSNGGSGGSGEWGSITGDINTQTDLPFTVENTTDAKFKGDVYASGDFFAQQNSTIYANNIKVGVTGDKLVITNQETGKQSLVSLNEIDSKVSTGTKDIFRYDAFSKTDPIGQGQPDDSLTFNSTSFTEDLTGQTKYFFQLTLTIPNQLVTDTWFLRSLTGFTNSYIYVYKGSVDFSTLTGQQDTKYWTTNTEKDIIEGNNLVTDAGGAGVDIEYKLGNSFFEKVGDVYTYVVIAENNFTIQGQTFTGVDVPYTIADGSRWGLVNTSSKVIINGNLSPNEFNGVLQLNSNSTEYYGCDVLLDAGIYDRFELPYKNRNTTTGTSYLYAIILDQDDNTIAYKRLDVSAGGSTSGTLTIMFDTDVLIEESGLYQVVIGRRRWNGTSRRIELFHKDVNSSDGSVWIAYANSNAALNVDDTSAIDWSTINKQNFNRIPKTLIYKF